jgi:Ca-activated chloride channel homolog
MPHASPQLNPIRNKVFLIFSTTVLAIALIAVFSVASAKEPQSKSSPSSGYGSGSLQAIGENGSLGQPCPLRHTDVKAEITGSIARVNVTQEFTNPLDRKIEAIYVFPLPQDAAVDDMTMKVGDRTIRGVIKQRAEARKIYENAKQQGHVASLLDQERPNIFTQAVANITPGAAVTITVSYVETLKYDEGHYEFMFPMVVGPRYIPGTPTGVSGGGWSPDTTKVPDASKITPPVAIPGTRAGHDISIAVKLDAGVAIQDLRSELHKVSIDRTGASSARVTLASETEIPNRDFILRYDVAGAQISDAVLTYRPNVRADPGYGYFALMLQPPERFRSSDVTPKELVFVLDTSGSMMGFPIEKGKQLVSRALTGLNSKDTFNLITFSGDTSVLFPEPVYPTPENLSRAQEFLKSRRGGGGTEMMKAIRAALAPSDEHDHIRIVIFVTDGYVGNDMEIIGEVQKHPNARVFSFGIGNSVNRFLLDGMAHEGRGEVEYVTLQGDADATVERLYQRLRSPLLTDISVDFGSLQVSDTFPKRIPDLFAAKPLVIYGRYTSPGSGTITLHGKRSGEPWSRTLHVDLPQQQKSHDVLASLWARNKIADLMAQDWTGLQRGTTAPEIEKQITQLGLDYRLMTQFTSFVAVEERTVTEGGAPVTVQVPVELPDGVSYEGIFGNEKKEADVAFGAAGFVGAQNYKSLIIQRAPVSRETLSTTQPAATPIVPPPPRTKVDEAGRHFDSNMPSGSRDRRDKLQPRLDATLFHSWTCAQLAGSQVNGPASCRTALTGPTVRVQIFLKHPPADVLDRLKKLGFVSEPSTKTLIGTVPIAALDKIAALDFVDFIKSLPNGTSARK